MPSLIKKRTQQRWRGSIVVDGKAYQKLFPDDLKKSQRKAMMWEIEKRKKLQQEPIATGSSTTIIEWANEYLDFSEERFVKRTFDEKKYVFKRLSKHFSPGFPVREISVPQVFKFLRNESRTRSGNAANKDRKNLAAAFKWGRKYLPGFPQGMNNPFRAVDKFPSQQHPRYVPPEKDFWAVYEVAEGQDRVMLFTFLHLAARRTEVFKLKWVDVDFVDNRIRLWTRKRLGGSLEADWIPMTAELRKTLLTWWEGRPVKTSEYVFVSISDLPCIKHRLGKRYIARGDLMKRLCEKAKVKKFGFHSIRHLTASILYHNGCDISLIQRVLRHKNATTTNRYLQNLGIEAVRKGLEESLKGPAEVIDLTERKRAIGEK
jgi:integrase